jgi:uncharacterized protein with PQ loop repeat
MIDASTVVGIIAGGLVLSGAIPQIVRNIRKPEDASGQSLMRNALIVSGNVMWVLQGYLTSNLAIALTCSISAILNGVIILQMITQKERIRRPKL